MSAAGKGRAEGTPGRERPRAAVRLRPGAPGTSPAPEQAPDVANMATYRPDLDARSSGVRFQRIDMIEASPFQVRRVFPEAEIEELANSIRDHGLIHEPKGRPHPTKPGWVELMPGELRLRALRRLIERGEIGTVLKQDTQGHWVIPMQIVEVDDERAEAIIFAENDARTDLSAWEWALAWQQRREMRRARGMPATVKEVAESHGKPIATVGEYLRVADVLNEEVLRAAGIVSMGEPDHARMARLSFAALKTAANVAVTHGTEEAAAYLLRELQRVGDRAARPALQRRSATRAAPARQTFQVNIRQPLPDLTPKQATHYLDVISQALPILAERASEGLDAATHGELVGRLKDALQKLKRKG